MPVSVPLRAEFNFKESFAAQRLKVQRLQNLFAGLIALYILLLSHDVVYCSLLELTLLLVLFLARRGVTRGAAVERLVVQNESVEVLINGEHHSLSAYGLDYFSSWLALVRVRTVAGESYRCFVFPGLLGAEKYRQLIALLKAKAT